MTTDIAATAAEFATLAQQLAALLAGAQPPALVLARALAALDAARSTLAAAVQAVADAQRPNS